MTDTRYPLIAASNMTVEERDKQRNKRKKFRARKKASKSSVWMLEKELKRRWREKKEKWDKERELEIQEAELMANRRREEYALTLEEKAKQIRLQCEDVRCTDDEYISLCTTLRDSDAGTLNLSSCQLTSCIDTSTTDTLQKAVHYRDLAEELKRDNRKLRVEMSEKIEAVRKFWRNSILEEQTRAGKMVMIALRKSKHADHQLT